MNENTSSSVTAAHLPGCSHAFRVYTCDSALSKFHCQCKCTCPTHSFCTSLHCSYVIPHPSLHVHFLTGECILCVKQCSTLYLRLTLHSYVFVCAQPCRHPRISMAKCLQVHVNTQNVSNASPPAQMAFGVKPTGVRVHTASLSKLTASRCLNRSIYAMVIHRVFNSSKSN